MSRYWAWLMLCTGLWTKAILLLAVATIAHMPMLGCWGLLAAMAGSVAICKVMIERSADCERLRLETLAAVMAREALLAQSKGELHSVT